MRESKNIVKRKKTLDENEFEMTQNHRKISIQVVKDSKVTGFKKNLELVKGVSCSEPDALSLQKSRSLEQQHMRIWQTVWRG